MTDSDEGRPALELRGISKHFGGVQALSDIDLSLHRSQITALVGDNGAGKSTLTKVLSGIYAPDRGEILRNGKPVRFTGPQDAVDAGIQTVYQDLALCDNLNTVQNLFLGRELGGKVTSLFQLSWEEMESRAHEVLSNLGVKIKDLTAPISQLSGGQRQGIAICRSILTTPDVVLLDEPTAALGVTQKEQVRNLLERLRDQGIAVMVISHDMQDVRHLADRVEVIRLGRKTRTFLRGQYSGNDVVDAITGASQQEGVTA
ncbi:ATP-binding cassette domain-containing protein [Herbiconiux liukaitaii]|uniref:ATP-binding cassette domain-containing protein n=1 Tax=Herbiconiux liukaitaii TaxID=3342799 RepID=UPI0035BABC10